MIPNTPAHYIPRMPATLLSQASSLDAETLFYLTLTIIFVTAIVTTVLTKWARDKCLKFLRHSRVTLERSRGGTLWGRLKVFSNGIEVMYDHPYLDVLGRRKTSHLFYQADLDTQVLSILRYHGHLSAEEQEARLRQVRRTFNPRFFRRLWRGVRNFVNTLRDAFSAAIGAAVTQFQRTSPAGAALAGQAGAVTSAGQTILGRVANAYEPLLEQYVGKPVILEVADPIDPNNAAQEYPGYLADYTQQFIAIFNVEHGTGEELRIALPDVEAGDVLPPLPPPPPPGAPAPLLPAPLKVEAGLAVRLDGRRVKLMNTRHEPLAVERIERAGDEPLPLRMLLPPRGTLSLPARDARGGTLVCTVVRCLDVVAPRKFATVHHAGDLLRRHGLLQDLELDRLPLLSQLFNDDKD